MKRSLYKTLLQAACVCFVICSAAPASADVPVDYWVGVLKKDGSLVKNEAETQEYVLAKEKQN